MDVVYIISAREDKDIFKRLETSIQSLRAGTTHFKLGIADTSPENALDELRKLDIGLFSHIHSQQTGLYNRSYNINLGVKRFVRESHFWLSDADIVYKPHHLKTCVELSRDYDYLTFSMKKVQQNGSVELVEAGGGFYCKTSIFKQIGGFDEAYVGWGAEDCDFTERVIHAGARAKRWIKDPILTHLWHPSNNTDPKQAEANMARLLELRKRICQR